MGTCPYLLRRWPVAFALPLFRRASGYSLGAVLESRELLDLLLGVWWFFALFVVNGIFNTILGEEFLFPGVLLPKMERVFGRWSWVANGVLFGFYHPHQPWGIPGSIISGVFLYAFPSWRFRSTWMGVIVHSAQSVYFAFLILGVVLGLAQACGRWNARITRRARKRHPRRWSWHAVRADCDRAGPGHVG